MHTPNGVKPLVFTDHSLEQFRKRWTDARGYSDAQLMVVLTENIRGSQQNATGVQTPSGCYHPFSFFGEDGYAVVVGEQQVVTVLPVEWCPEVNEQREHG